jgi:beta-lactamase regulating signal transducer with metallopeptidase domain
VISTLVQATVVAAVALVAVRIGRRWSPALRESIVTLALLKFLLPGTVVGGGLFAFVASWMASPHPLAPTPTAPVSSLATGLVVFQITGMVLVAARLAASCLTCRRILRTATNILDGPVHERALQVAARLGMRRLPSIWVSANTAAPLAFGVFARHVVLPAALLDDESGLDVVLAHELAHHRRGDLWKFTLHGVVVTVWWWHPLAWALAAPLREAVEDGCDDMVLASGVAAEDRYADVLVASARSAAPPTVVALGFGNRRHPVARRLVRLASDRAQASWRTWVVAAGCSAIVLPGIPSGAQEQPAVVARIVNAEHIERIPSTVETIRPPRRRTSRESIRALTATALSGLETIRTPDAVREAIAGAVEAEAAAEALGSEPLAALLIESRRLDVMSLVLREVDDAGRRVVNRIVHRVDGRRGRTSSSAPPSPK